MKRFALGAAILIAFPAAISAQTNLLIVSGLGGEPRYVQDFHNWGVEMAEAASSQYGLPDENIVLLTEDPSKNGSVIDGESRRDRVLAEIAAAAGRAGPDDRFMLLLIGHGSADSRGNRINLPGPDLTAEEISNALDAFSTQPVVVVNTASASGDFVDILEGTNRTVVTATRSGMERNETVFGRFFVEAFAGDAADTNQDGRLTLSEAYAYAESETARDYTNRGALQLEHSRMEGNMELAAAFHLGNPAAAIPSDASPALRALYERRTEIENSIDALRAQSGQMDAADYQSRLEELLLDLARTNRDIQESGTGG